MAAHRSQHACSVVAGSLRWPGTCLPLSKPVSGRNVHLPPVCGGGGGDGGDGGDGGGGDGGDGGDGDGELEFQG